MYSIAQKQTDALYNLVSERIGEEEKIIIMAMLCSTWNYLCYFVTKLYPGSVALFHPRNSVRR